MNFVILKYSRIDNNQSKAASYISYDDWSASAMKLLLRWLNLIPDKVYKITAIILSLFLVLSFVTSILPFNRHKVTTEENAIIIAKAELLRLYGELEVDGLEFRAVRFGDIMPNYWYVIALPGRLGDQPHVFVRISDGKVKMRWRSFRYY